MYNAKPADYQRAIEARLREIDAALSLADVAADTVTLDQSSVGRLTRLDAMQQQAMAAEMRDRLKSQSAGLKAALDRMAAGSYGMCCECADEIDAERLDGNPAVVFCSGCAAGRMP